MFQNISNLIKTFKFNILHTINQYFAYNKGIRCYKTTLNWPIVVEIHGILGPIELKSVPKFMVVLLSSKRFK
jgi:hypothetical protein